ncbi:LysR family transcriptional regulator [Serratia ureilytica]
MLTNLSDIDLKLLRVFVAVADSQGVSAAQEALLMNQSTISTHGLAGNPAGFSPVNAASGFR